METALGIVIIIIGFFFMIMGTKVFIDCFCGKKYIFINLKLKKMEDEKVPEPAAVV